MRDGGGALDARKRARAEVLRLRARPEPAAREAWRPAHWGAVAQATDSCRALETRDVLNARLVSLSEGEGRWALGSTTDCAHAASHTRDRCARKSHAWPVASTAFSRKRSQSAPSHCHALRERGRAVRALGASRRRARDGRLALLHDFFFDKHRARRSSDPHHHHHRGEEADDVQRRSGRPGGRPRP